MISTEVDEVDEIDEVDATGGIKRIIQLATWDLWTHGHCDSSTQIFSDNDDGGGEKLERNSLQRHVP
ncbi:hypothetical protein ACN38_g7770 [Penicillium nordicum]|uniref:Uncharacterized protein n=1 Tax=Penicillium nordicum TaxID=229535 RepID=A0A0M9WE35_9EURO|nr:hypothetical protein ACN38_g7770 [Penicillium nordicum]